MLSLEQNIYNLPHFSKAARPSFFKESHVAGFTLRRSHGIRRIAMEARILIINDTRTILAWYQRFLQAEGYTVYTTPSLTQEMRMIEHSNPDLIIFDFFVSNTNDILHLLHSLKMNQATASIPILLCTIRQHAIQGGEQNLRRQGVEVLYKPFRVHDLLGLVRQMLLARKEHRSQP